jgi:hypothetical protein
MEPHEVEAYFSLIGRAALQDAMADLAHEADRTRQTDFSGRYVAAGAPLSCAL